MSEPYQECKICVFGYAGVGKSALTIRLVTDNFLDEYDPTIEDSYRKPISINDDGKQVDVLLDILDTAGREEYAPVNPWHLRESHGCLIVYDITSRVTFEEIAVMRNKILAFEQDNDHDDNTFPMTIVGNKCDLDKQRQVTKEEGAKYAQECGVPFYETSAKTKINNEECFHQVVRDVLQIRRQQAEATPHKKKNYCTVL